MGALRKRLPQLTAPIHSMAFVLNQVWCGLRDGTVTVVSAERYVVIELDAPCSLANVYVCSSGDEIKSFSRAHSAAVTHVAEIGGKIWCGSTDGKITVWKPDEIGHDEGVVKLKEGVLSRQTGEKKLFRSWKAQWYSLFKQGYIEIYKGAGSAELVGQIDLKDATVEISAKKSLRFTIKSGDKPVTLQAKSEAVRVLVVGRWSLVVGRWSLVVGGRHMSLTAIACCRMLASGSRRFELRLRLFRAAC